MGPERKWVYDFAEGSRDMRELLGGKGANVAEMTRVLGAERVPAGFTITTEACVAYMNAGQQEPEGMADEVAQALERLQEHAGKRLGDDENPLLVSVRSGARVSMPGMMDTVLNLGLNDRTVQGLARRSGNERFAWDAYRRFVHMYADVVLGLKSRASEHVDPFSAELEALKKKRGIQADPELTTADLKELVTRFKRIVKERWGHDFPDDPNEQLWGAISAVFASWNCDRALAYRSLNHIPSEWGTAV